VPTTFVLRVSFSPVPECVKIGLLESNFSDPAAAPGTLLLMLLFYTHSHSSSASTKRHFSESRFSMILPTQRYFLNIKDTCNIYMQYIHSRKLQYIHALKICNMYMQYMHAIFTCNICIHAIYAWNICTCIHAIYIYIYIYMQYIYIYIYMQYMHAIYTCNIYMQYMWL
jgi:hypothetical protein